MAHLELSRDINFYFRKLDKLLVSIPFLAWVSIRIVPRVMDTVMERDVWRMKIKRSSPGLKKARIKPIKYGHMISRVTFKDKLKEL